MTRSELQPRALQLSLRAVAALHGATVLAAVVAEAFLSQSMRIDLLLEELKGTLVVTRR